MDPEAAVSRDHGAHSMHMTRAVVTPKVYRR